MKAEESIDPRPGLPDTVRSWGRWHTARTKLLRPRSAAELRSCLKGTVIPRAGGRSQGDAALNDGGTTAWMSDYRETPFAFDPVSGVLRCSPGLTQREVLSQTLKHGWSIPAIPGSGEITLGGLVAADAHGKNHFHRGNIGRWLRSLSLLTASGDLVACHRDDHGDLFRATVGGLGLTGFIVAVEMQLEKIPSLRVFSRDVGFNGLDEMFEVVEANRESGYLVGCADGRFAPGRPFRGLVTLGEHAPADEVPRPWEARDPRPLRLPFGNPLPGAGSLAATALNLAVSGKFGRSSARQDVGLWGFLFPQDRIANWNLAYGRRGFLDYHFCLPAESARTGLGEVVGYLQRERILSGLTGIKRFGPAASEGLLSFPQDGFSLALDLPLRRHTWSQVRELDARVVDHGGRLYLVKDSHLDPAMVRRMYPGLEEWVRIKRTWDPRGLFASGLSRRLEMGS